MNNTAASSRRRPGALPTSATSTDDTNKLQAQYKQDKEKFADFIRNFKTEENGEETFKYVEILKKIATREQKILNIELDDLTTHFKNEILTEAIIKNTVRYVNLFCDVIDEELPTTDMPVNEEDVLDVLRMHRLTSMTHNGAKNKPGPARPADASTNNKQESEETLPKELLRRYELNFIAPHKMPEVPLREVRARHIGQLVSVRGVVTRCSEVKPLLQIATYTCEDCGFEIYQRITQRVYIPLHQCPNCAKTTGRGQLTQQTRGCKFVKFQDMRIQENAAQVPIGHVPRTLHVHIQGELTRHCAPGDNITVHGVFLPLANEGFQAIKTGLVAETYLYAMHVVQHKKKYSEFNPTEDMASKIEKFIEEPDAYTRLARSIAPEIWGMLDVKKALLLQMVGGVTKVMRDGMKIRGDINICLMGDPGVAKSQLLKHIATLAPRAVYTSGKGSSGVGLTAAILKDPITGEMTLEGGSLVLSDMGICCIDEFDKMDDYDRTAIHEVMEQQTISIAKAGITTSLNARTAILAAANPAYGRYNPARPPLENINLPAALLSRFDLLFLLLDKADPIRDRELAEHVTHVHRFSRHPTMDTEACSPEFIRAFIALAKRQQPSIPRELRTHLVDSYVNMRHDDLTQHRRGGQFTYTTARTLLATLRIAQALARLRFATHVTSADVEEALRLLDASKASLWESQHGSGAAGGARRAASDFATAVFGIVRDWALSHDEIELNYEDLLPVVLARGYSQEQFDKTLEIYERLEIWIVSANRRTITFVSHGQ